MSHDSTDPAVADWDLAMGSTSAQLRHTQQALAASQADLSRVEREREKAIDLLEYALHLRMHGERAPGGNETWREFDRRCEQFLRDPSARPAPHLEAVKRERDTLAVLNAELKDEVTQRLGDQLRAAEREQVLRDELASMARDLTRISKERDNLRAELTGAYQRLGDAEAERDQLRTGLADATVARHAAEAAHAHCPTPTEESRA